MVRENSGMPCRSTGEKGKGVSENRERKKTADAGLYGSLRPEETRVAVGNGANVNCATVSDVSGHALRRRRPPPASFGRSGILGLVVSYKNRDTDAGSPQRVYHKLPTSSYAGSPLPGPALTWSTDHPHSLPVVQRRGLSVPSPPKLTMNSFLPGPPTPIAAYTSCASLGT